VAAPSIDLGELLDLKILPAWVHEPAQGERYAHFDGIEERPHDRHPSRREGDRRKRRTPNFQRPTSKADKEKRGREGAGRRPARRREQDRHKQFQRHQGRHQPAQRAVLEVTVRFLPHPHALENVVEQIKTNSVAYSLFALARLFLAKPERYDVRLTASAASPLVRLGENGTVSSNRDILERNAFHLAQSDFYKVEITEAEPIKGNFTNVARCRLSGTTLGPTNHHDYQKRLRGLYEQRFSRRMSFSDYQRQIDIVSDPQLVEKWKEEARKIATFSTLREETPATFSSAAEAERHFRQHYLPDLIRNVQELTIDGNASRRLGDRAMHSLIEKEWMHETRSPSNMMQELAAQFRQAGLQVFRHRRGMLFVSPIRVRPLAQGAVISPAVSRIVETVSAAPGTHRKELADKLIAGLDGENGERAKLALASDLRWLISEGYVIEFNDGTLDLPRVKAPNPRPQAPEKPQDSISKTEAPSVSSPPAEAVVPAAVMADAAFGQGNSVTNLDGASQKRPTIEEAENG
jgi:hypothetical protein